MKLTVDNERDKVRLDIATTGGNTKTFFFPKIDIHFWYPFNLNFYYIYSDAKEFMYLAKERGYEGKNYYHVDILKRTKPLDYIGEVPVHDNVYYRNMYIMNKADNLGIATLKNNNFTLYDVQDGFNKVGDYINYIKEIAEERYIDSGGEIMLYDTYTEERDREIYKHLTEREEETLIELGEMYSMLTVMRKLVEEN